MASVTAALAAQGGDALKAAKSLVDRAEQTDFTLGGVLRTIHETGVFKTLGFDGKRGFDEYVERTLGIASRKARYLMAIYTKFALLGVDETRLEEIGWSKAKELARIEDAELKKDFTKLVKKATDSTRDELIEHIKTKYKVTTRGGGGDNSVKMVDFRFRLAEEEATTVTEGLKEACTAAGTDDLNVGFAYLVGDWRNTGTGQDLDLEQSMEMLCAKFGLQRITFTDAEGTALEFEPEAAATDEGTATTETTAAAEPELATA
jgi:hypothetical protein